MNKHFMVIAILACGSCATVPTPERAYRPSEIVQNINSLERGDVRVVGYLRLGPEVRALWDSQAHFEDARDRRASGGDPIWNHCITAFYDYAIAPAVENAIGTMIDAVGTVGVDRDELGGIDLWSCNDIHITLHRVNR